MRPVFQTKYRTQTYSQRGFTIDNAFSVTYGHKKLIRR